MKALATTPDHRSTRRQTTAMLFYLFLAAIVVLLISSNARGQSTKKKEPPKPRPVTLKTKDGIKLRAFYFPSDQEKDAIPVLLVHEWEGQASPYVRLVVALRDAGCAVLALEYRGHGGSREYVDRRGEVKKFNLATMSKADVANIISRDMEEAKEFLKKENNDGKLNLNALVVVGVREGCVIAANWAARDWSFATVGSRKRGQDVKALVMISPKKLAKGIPMDPVLTNAAVMALPIMFIAGSESPDADDTDRIVKRVEAYKKRVGRGVAEGLEVKMVKTSLSGPALVKESPNVIPSIKDFILGQVKISDEENAWIARED